MKYDLKIDGEIWDECKIDRVKLLGLIHCNTSHPENFRKYILEHPEAHILFFFSMNTYYVLFKFYGLDLLELLPKTELNDFIEDIYPDILDMDKNPKSSL